MRDVVAELAGEPPELVALTMTAELSDEFRTKREGVGFVLDAVEAALARARPGLHDRGRAREPRRGAGAAARRRRRQLGGERPRGRRAHPDALMLDVGSTTADVIPIAAGRVAAVGRTDLDRLLAGELVYTGALRTNLAAIAPRVPVRGRWCPVASELFAISGDVHLILGHLAPDGLHVPDAGRAGGERRVRARARGAARLRRRRAARARPRSTRSPPICTPSRCARSRRRRAR